MIDPADALVGARIMMRRRTIGMSQKGLAARVGVTFQQIQKYEKGSNRVSASRMQMISSALQAPVASFFEGDISSLSSGPSLADLPKDFVTLAESYLRLRNTKSRETVMAMLEALAEL